MQEYKIAAKILETKISSNLESLNFQTCHDIKRENSLSYTGRNTKTYSFRYTKMNLNF